MNAGRGLGEASEVPGHAALPCWRSMQLQICRHPASSEWHAHAGVFWAGVLLGLDRVLLTGHPCKACACRVHRGHCASMCYVCARMYARACASVTSVSLVGSGASCAGGTWREPCARVAAPDHLTGRAVVHLCTECVHACALVVCRSAWSPAQRPWWLRHEHG